MATPVQTLSFQAQFHQKRGHLSDPQVRDLAWLLDSPALLDMSAPQWQGQVAQLFAHQGPAIDAWLCELDRNPEALHALVNSHGFARLGRYAELLMRFFFLHIGVLQAHGLQVRAGKKETIGEFDFLLWHQIETAAGAALYHWEFATKFYLLESYTSGRNLDHLVGPNLADSMGAKMRKIMTHQLALSSHPAAQVLLPQSVDVAQALIKGWLFYPRGEDAAAFIPPGIAAAHCRGFWCSLAEADDLSGEYYLILPRLSWLAPARTAATNCLNKQTLQASLSQHFLADSSPVLVAVMTVHEDIAIEVERWFIVPNDWQDRAATWLLSRKN